jgi:protein ImuB
MDLTARKKAVRRRLLGTAGFRRLRVAKDELAFDAEMELDSPIELLDSLCFVFQRLLDDLLGRLVRASLSTNEVRVRLAMERAQDHVTTLRLPVPMTESKETYAKAWRVVSIGSVLRRPAGIVTSR